MSGADGGARVAEKKSGPAAGAYGAAGVSLDRAEAAEAAARLAAERTKRPGVAEEVGGFGALFDLAAAGWQDPLLVAACDGVGTKLLLASAWEEAWSAREASAAGESAGGAGSEGGDEGGSPVFADALAGYRAVGRDLVAMCVNDLATRGAEALFFLDYLAAGRLEGARDAALLAGISESCRAAGAGLIGGETAELPGLYQGRHFDLAGFALGAVERERVLPQTERIRPGDRLWALPATGVHANGFSLVRRILQASSLPLLAPAPFAGGGKEAGAAAGPENSLGSALLAPTPVFARPLRKLAASGRLKAAAHITGGGALGNLPRVLPQGTAGLIEAAAVPRPPVLAWLQAAGGVPETEMWRVFNCGLGVVLVGDESLEEALPEDAFACGEVAAGESADAAPVCRIV